MTKPNDIMNVESKFYSALGNGKDAAKHLAAMVESVFVSRDTGVLVRAIYRAEQKKEDAQAAQAIRTCVRTVWPTAKVSKDKNGQPRILIKGDDGDKAAVKRIREAADKGLSIRGAAFRKAVVGDTGNTPDWTVQKWATNQAKQAIKHDVTEAAAIAALKAAFAEALKAS